MLNVKNLLIFMFIITIHTAQPLTLNRVILATDNHPNYIQFWPIVAKAWKEIVGIIPTLALIADSTVEIDETLGDIIRFEPIEDIPTSLQAQTIRLLLPVLFPDDVCILSDIDMIPLQKDYFVNSIKGFPEDAFVVYQNRDYDPKTPRWPICYCAARGSTFAEIFQITTMKKIRELITEWNTFGLGWDTDEKTLFQYASRWRKYKTHCFLLNHTSAPQRIDRHWPHTFKPEYVPQGYYRDMHCQRPWSRYKDEILSILAQIPTPLRKE